MKEEDNWAERQIPAVANGVEDTEKNEVTEKGEDKKKTEEVKEKKKDTDEYLGLCRTIRLYFREYCQNSSLHGIRYMGEKGRSSTERVWWALIFMASIFFSVYLIRKTWIKWDLSPVIVSFAQSPTPVWKIPFPAVTICSEVKSRQSVFNFTDVYNLRSTNLSRITPEIMKKFQDVSLVCDRHVLTVGRKTTDQSAIDFIHEIAPPFEQTYWQCNWTSSQNSSCKEFFSPTLTEEGICYTFNMLDSPEIINKEAQNKHYLNHGNKSDWSLNDGYGKKASMDVYPRRALGAGTRAGLSIIMRVYDNDLDYICKGPVQGYKILLHNPAEIPRVGQQYFRAPLDQEVTVAVKPDMMTTSPGLKDYDPSRRHCFFPEEKKLRFYKIYTQRNCEVECLTNFTLQTCNCVAYYMPRSNNTSICGSGSSKCISKAQRNLLLNEVKAEIDKEINGDSKNMEKCNCLPSCTSLYYNAQTSQADFDWKKLLTNFQYNMSEFKDIRMARVNIFFKDTQFITSHRSELYGQTDFLANCGGLLGLFMGFSFLSLVEIIYFLTLRMWCNIKMYGKNMWSDSKIRSMKRK